MPSSFKYLWPLIAYCIVYVITRFVSLPFPEVASHLSSLLFTLVAIYYLYTSPFSQDYFLPLFSLLLIRYFIPIMVPFTWTTALSFYCGSNMAILFFYSMRTLNKEPLRRVDYTKLILVGVIIILIVANYIVILYSDDILSYDLLSFKVITITLRVLTQILIAALVIIHLRMLAKWEKDSLDRNEEELIDKIGEESNRDKNNNNSL